MTKRPRYRAHRDANQEQDVETLRRLGFWIKDVSQWFETGDLLIAGWDAARQEIRLTLWEWKTEKGEPTKKQKEFIDRHTFAYLGRCVEDVLRVYGQIQ